MNRYSVLTDKSEMIRRMDPEHFDWSMGECGSDLHRLHHVTVCVYFYHLPKLHGVASSSSAHGIHVHVYKELDMRLDNSKL